MPIPFVRAVLSDCGTHTSALRWRVALPALHCCLIGHGHVRGLGLRGLVPLLRGLGLLSCRHRSCSHGFSGLGPIDTNSALEAIDAIEAIGTNTALATL